MAALVELTTEDVGFRDSRGREYSGRERLMAQVGAVHAAFPDLRCEVLAAVGEGDGALARVRYTGTHTGHSEKIATTGTAVAYDGMAHVAVADGRIATLWVLDDMSSLHRQLTGAERSDATEARSTQRVTPTLRSMDWNRSRQFWVDALGFRVAFEWRHAPAFPVYAGIDKDGAVLHISEHTGDCEPGGSVSILVDDVEAVHADIAGRRADMPDVLSQPWGRREFTLRDPDGNKIIFFENTDDG